MWLYENEEFVEPGDHVGFVYLITNMESGKSYVGKKLFKFTRRKKARGRRAVVTRVDSDWQEYFGSSKELLADVERIGRDAFRREILHLCRTKGECSYLELVEQCRRDVLRRPEEYYNAFIGGKVSRAHLP